MQKEQLEKKFVYGLEYLNIWGSHMGSNGFKHKELSKKNVPYWPAFMSVYVQKSMRILDL